MNKLQWEQEKRDKEWTKINELRNVLREGQERLELHNFRATLDDTYERIKTEPINDWVIHQMSKPLRNSAVLGIVPKAVRGC